VASLRRAGADDGCNEVVGCGLGLLQGGGFDHDPHKGFGAAESNEDTASVTQRLFDRSNVVSDDLGNIVATIFKSDISQHLRESLHCRVSQDRKRGLGTAYEINELDTGKHTIASRCPIGKNDVARLLATKRTRGASKSFKNVAISHWSLDNFNPLRVHS